MDGIAASSSTRKPTMLRTERGAISTRKMAIPIPSGTATKRAIVDVTTVP